MHTGQIINKKERINTDSAKEVETFHTHVYIGHFHFWGNANECNGKTSRCKVCCRLKGEPYVNSASNLFFVCFNKYNITFGK